MNTRLEGGTNNRENGVVCNVTDKNGKTEALDADICLLSIGRKPYTSGLGLEHAGLETNKFGRIDINKTW